MRKIIAFYSGPFVGTDSNCAFLVPENLTDAQIYDWIAGWAWEEHEHWIQEEDDDLEDEGPDFYWEDYAPEEHDMLRGGGGSFEKDFE
jgi:hypothetical protein